MAKPQPPPSHIAPLTGRAAKACLAEHPDGADRKRVEGVPAFPTATHEHNRAAFSSAPTVWKICASMQISEQ